MKIGKWLFVLGACASIAYSGRELLEVGRLASGLAARPEPSQAALAAPGVPSVAASRIGEEIKRLSDAARIGEDAAAPSDAPETTAAPKPRVFAPRPEHAEASDTNSSGGKVFVAKARASDKASMHGGAVIIDADGRRLELVPPDRPKPTLAARAARAAAELPKKMEMPVLDDPSAGLERRKRRAQSLLLASVALAFGLVLWARRYRAGA